VAAVARAFGRSRTTVHRAMREHREKARKVVVKPRAEVVQRRRVVVSLAEKVTTRNGRTYPTFGSSRRIARELKRRDGAEAPSYRTVCRDLRASGLRAYKRPKTPTREAQHVRQHREYAKKMLKSKRRRSCCVSDEFWASCNERTGKVQWCFRRRDVLPLENKRRQNTPSVQVWFVCGVGYKGPLVIFPSRRESSTGELVSYRLTGQLYKKKCLTPMCNDKNYPKGRMFLQDNARPHIAKVALQYLKSKGIALHTIPPYAPMFNPAEKVVNLLKNRVGEECPTTLGALKSALETAWRTVPRGTLDKTVKSVFKEWERYA
jgi:hypothetical protein